MCCRENEAEDPGQLTLSFSAGVPCGKPQPEEQQSCHRSSSQNESPVIASSGKSRHSYFRARKLQRVCQPVQACPLEGKFECILASSTLGR